MQVPCESIDGVIFRNRRTTLLLLLKTTTGQGDKHFISPPPYLSRFNVFTVYYGRNKSARITVLGKMFSAKKCSLKHFQISHKLYWYLF